jgi:hypothetical protein
VELSPRLVAVSVTSGGNGGIPRGFGSLALASDMKVGWGLVAMLVVDNGVIASTGTPLAEASPYLGRANVYDVGPDVYDVT